MKLNVLAAWQMLINKHRTKKQLSNIPCYDHDGNFIGWYSRSVAAVIFVFCKDEIGRWCVLASERGKDAADFQGRWNCPCGYLDFNETTKDCARRELLEECGVFVEGDDVEFVGFDDDPVKANRQNITFRYAAILNDKLISDFTFSKSLNEGSEVGEIKWIPLDKIGLYKWAFGHDSLINNISDRYKLKN